ncbi:MAG: hypothetical protein KFF72_04200 [Arthrospira sp. SH-MAG29]|nr:hypothetical protein [Arthrospira sp. SH-MAG29]MBS0015561.1 hypothetical protein [Arthrospira sp. SH-MAG29]
MSALVYVFTVGLKLSNVAIAGDTITTYTWLPVPLCIHKPRLLRGLGGELTPGYGQLRKCHAIAVVSPNQP